VYNAEHQVVEIPRYFEYPQEGESAGIDVYYRGGKEYKPKWLCAVRKRVEETNRKKNHGKEPSGAQIANNR
jgi:hypothetical protein